MMKYVPLSLFMLCFASLNAQNLVPNSSFEEYDECPRNYNQLKHAIPWFRPTDGTTDYFNACDTFRVGSKITAGVPDNFFGHQEAHSGQGYAGVCLNAPGNNYREYLEVKLTQPLQPKMKYTVSFYYSAADSAKMAVKSIGVCFSKDSLLQAGSHNFPLIPQVSYDGDFILNTSHWTSFSKSFIASGGENYLVLGNFKDQSQTEKTYWSSISSVGTDIAYIYVDDVSVSADTSKIGQEGTDIFYIRPNLTMDEIFIFYYPQEKDSEINFKIFNLFGQVMSESTLHAGRTSLPTGSWSAGYYFYESKKSGQRPKEGKFLLVK